MSFVRYAGRVKTPAPTNASQHAPNYSMKSTKEKDKQSMPLHKGKSKEIISENISEMVHAGHPQKQAVAASLNKADESGNKIAKPHHHKHKHEQKHHASSTHRHKEHR
jgi:hypothetical protein